MSISKEEEARRQGMAYALKIAKEKGIEGLEEELRFRGCTKLPIGVSRKACNEAIMKIKNQTCDSFRVLSLATLRDEFDFGKQRLERFSGRFNYKAECLADDFCSWQDIVENIKKETGLDEFIRVFDKDVVDRG